jgi:hypothetical protein
VVKPVAIVAAALVAAPLACAAAVPTIGTKLAGRVATLIGKSFPVTGCPKAVSLHWKHAGNDVTVAHALGSAKLIRPHGTFAFVWRIPASLHGPVYVYVDDNCVVKGQQQAYETYYSFTAP